MNQIEVQLIGEEVSVVIKRPAGEIADTVCDAMLSIQETKELINQLTASIYYLVME